MIVDIVFVNGEVITVDKKQGIEEAVAIKGNQIIAVGSNECVQKYISEGTKVIDLKGRSLLPGFIDSHLHMTMTGTKQSEVNCKDPHIHSLKDLFTELKDKVRNTSKGNWIRVWGFDEKRIEEKRYPTREELDQISTEHPIMIRRVCAHISVANSKGLEITGYTQNTPDPAGGTIERNGEGKLTGRLIEAANMEVFKASKYTDEELRKGMVIASNQFLASGITSIHDAGGFGPDNFRVMQQAVRSGDIRVRVYAMVSDVAGGSETFIDKMIKAGISTGVGDERFRIGPAKIFLDGSSTGLTAASRSPYGQKSDCYGVLYHTQEKINTIFENAHKNGFQITAHAIGDRAIEMLLDGIEAILQKYPRENHRHRIEHATLSEPDLLHRIKELQVIPIPNPPFFYEFGDNYLSNYKDRVNYMFPLRDYIDNNILAAGGSDSAVTDFNPLLGIHVAMNRRSRTGQVVGATQKINVLEAIKIYTLNGAYASFEEEIKGSIEVGKLADLVVLNGSILRENTDNIKDMAVDMTVLDGEIVYQK